MQSSKLYSHLLRKSAAWVNLVDDDDFLRFGSSMYKVMHCTALHCTALFLPGSGPKADHNIAK
jgi:hypothetical protein